MFILVHDMYLDGKSALLGDLLFFPAFGALQIVMMLNASLKLLQIWALYGQKVFLVLPPHPFRLRTKDENKGAHVQLICLNSIEKAAMNCNVKGIWWDFGFVVGEPARSMIFLWRIVAKHFWQHASGLL